MAPLRIDALAPGDARAALRACCGSTRWIEAMLRRRPFGTEKDLFRTAREAWFELSPSDWLEAFADHPRIGDRDALARRFPETHHLAAGEQSGVAGSSGDVLDALARGNAAYESRFGHIFIVCATGLDAPTMLRMLQERLGNDPSVELRIAAEEQAKITAIRLSSVAQPGGQP